MVTTNTRLPGSNLPAQLGQMADEVGAVRVLQDDVIHGIGSLCELNHLLKEGVDALMTKFDQLPGSTAAELADARRAVTELARKLAEAENKNASLREESEQLKRKCDELRWTLQGIQHTQDARDEQRDHDMRLANEKIAALEQRAVACDAQYDALKRVADGIVVAQRSNNRKMRKALAQASPAAVTDRLANKIDLVNGRLHDTVVAVCELQVRTRGEPPTERKNWRDDTDDGGDAGRPAFNPKRGPNPNGASLIAVCLPDDSDETDDDPWSAWSPVLGAGD